MSSAPPPDRRFTSAQACAAAGISAQTLKNWSTGDEPALPIPNADRTGPGKGYPLLLSFARVMQIALTAALVARGLPPRVAAGMALAFTDRGTGGATIARLPSQLFPNGYTVLACYDDGAKVLNVQANTPLVSIFAPNRDAVTVLLVDTIHQRVCAVLAGERG